MCVVGLGYIGLPTAAVLSQAGFNVVGYDVNEEVVESLGSGHAHFFEPGLDALVEDGIKSGLLKFDSKPAIADVYMICVPTPLLKVDGKHVPDISFIEKSVLDIARVVKQGDLVILESTSPVGTTKLVNKMLTTGPLTETMIDVAYCPERVLPGNTINELVLNDRVVGGQNEKATSRAAKFYRQFVEGKVMETAAETAELCKLAENSFRDINIAYANELSLICSEHDLDVWELIALANRHPRVDILQPGPGVGGHCIAVDPWFIVSGSKNSRLIETARLVNDAKPHWVVDQIRQKAMLLGQPHPSIVCFGLSFKPNIDDFRESAALEVVLELLKRGNNVVAVEPNTSTHDQIEIISIDEALERGDLFVFLVAHEEFKGIGVGIEERAIPVLDFCGLLSDES